MMATDDSFIGPVNTGNPGEFTMLELAEKVIELTDSQSRIVFCPLPGDRPKQRKPDISLAKRTGWLGTADKAGRRLEEDELRILLENKQ